MCLFVSRFDNKLSAKLGEVYTLCLVQCIVTTNILQASTQAGVDAEAVPTQPHPHTIPKSMYVGVSIVHTILAMLAGEMKREKEKFPKT